MKFTFKKEWLLKYKFWEMLAAIPPAVLAGVFILNSVVGSEIQAKRDVIGKKAKEAGAPPTADQKNDAAIDMVKKMADSVKSEEVSVWEKAYKEQEPRFVFPKAFDDKCHFLPKFDKYHAVFFVEDIKIFTEKKKAADMPKDQPNYMYGTLTEVIKKEYFVLENRDGKKFTFLKTPNVKITANPPDKKTPHWDYMKPGSVLGVFYQNGKYFGDRCMKSELETFGKYYRTQLPAIVDQLDLLNPITGEGAVQIADWNYEKFLQLKEWARDEEAVPPTASKGFHYLTEFKTGPGDASDDLWIAQENLWIQDEIFRMIRLANDYVSRFDLVEKENKNKEVVFRNPFWEVALKLEGTDKLRAKLTNLLPRRQKLDFKLRVRLDDRASAVSEVIEFKPGLPLQPFGTAKNADSRTEVVELKRLTGAGSRKGIYALDQVLTWETAAVRRVDGVYISKVGNAISAGCRNFPDPLLPYPNRSAPAGAPATGAPAPPPPTKDPKGAPPPPPAPDPKGGKVMPNPQGGGQAGLPNGQARDRYTEVPEQLRRLPIAVVLIVEQGQVDRVQTAFNNSKMRFLTTQVLLNHYSSSVRPPLVEAPVVPNKLDPMNIKDPMFKKRPPDVQPPMDPKADPKKDQHPARRPSSLSDEMEANVEMVIYGIITLYERIPVRAKNPNP